MLEEIFARYSQSDAASIIQSALQMLQLLGVQPERLIISYWRAYPQMYHCLAKNGTGTVRYYWATSESLGSMPLPASRVPEFFQMIASGCDREKIIAAMQG